MPLQLEIVSEHKDILGEDHVLLGRRYVASGTCCHRLLGGSVVIGFRLVAEGDLGILEHVPGIEICLSYACIHSGADILKHVINEGAELNKTDAKGNNKLHLVCQTKVEPAEKIQILLQEKPSLAKQRNARGLLPVHYAVRRSNIDGLKHILRHSSSTVNARTRDRRLTPLHIAAHFGLKAHVEFLLTFFRTDVNALDVNRDTPAHHAAAAGHTECLLMLMKHADYRADVTNKRNRTPADDLPEALAIPFHAVHSDFDTFRTFVGQNRKLGAYRHDGGNTILHLICSSSYVDILAKAQYITSTDSSLLSIRNADGKLPIHELMLSAKDDEKNLVLEHFLSFDECRLRVNTPDKHGMTALHYASQKGNYLGVDILGKEKRTDVNAQDVNGNTAAHLASMKDDTVTLNRLDRLHSVKPCWRKA